MEAPAGDGREQSSPCQFILGWLHPLPGPPALRRAVVSTVLPSSQPRVAPPPAVPTFPRTWPCPHRHQQSSAELSSRHPECATCLLTCPAGSPGPPQLASLSIPNLSFIPSHLKQLSRVPPRSARASVPGPVSGRRAQACLTTESLPSDHLPLSPGMPSIGSPAGHPAVLFFCFHAVP